MGTPRESPAGAGRREADPPAPPGGDAPSHASGSSPVHVIAFSPAGLHETNGLDRSSLEAWRRTGLTTWVDVQGLGDPAVLADVAEVFGLHHLVMEDAVHIVQRPKAEDYDEQLFVVARMTPPDTLDTEQLGLVLGPGFLVSFQERPGDVFDGVRARLRSGRARIRGGGPDYLAYALLDAVVDAYMPLVEELSEELDALDDALVEDPESIDILALYDLRRRLTECRRVLSPTREALLWLSRHDSERIADPTRPYLRDCVDHVSRLLDEIHAGRELASSLVDLQIALSSHRTNEVMKVLTVVGAIFIPLTFLAGLYGMNFAHMPELRHPWGYPAVLVVMVAVAALLLAWFRRRGWIGRPSRSVRAGLPRGGPSA